MWYYLYLNYRDKTFLKSPLLNTWTLSRNCQLQIMQTKVLRKWSQAPIVSESSHTFLLWPRKQTRKVFKTTKQNRIFLLSYTSERKEKSHLVAALEGLILVSISSPTMSWAVTPFLGSVPSPRHEVHIAPALKETLWIPFFVFLQLQGAYNSWYTPNHFTINVLLSRGYNKTAPITAMNSICC